MSVLCEPCKKEGVEVDAVLYVGLNRIPMCDTCWPLADPLLRRQGMQRVDEPPKPKAFSLPAPSQPASAPQPRKETAEPKESKGPILDALDSWHAKKKAAENPPAGFEVFNQSEHLCKCGKPKGHQGRCPGQHLKPEKIEEAKKFLMDGKSLRQTQALTKLSKTTVLIARSELGDKIPPCNCGKPGGHRGWCWQRVQNSPKRQETLARLHQPKGENVEEKTSRKVSIVKSTHSEMTVEESNNTALQQQFAELKSQMDEIQKQLGAKPFDFWYEPEQMSIDCQHGQDEDGALLWGAKVPIEVLDAIWYSLTNQAKANLLSAIAVSRYKEKTSAPGS